MEALANWFLNTIIVYLAELSRTICFCYVTCWQLLVAAEGLNIILLSLDQEKAFLWFNRDFLFQTWEASGFGPPFTSTI